LLLWLLYCNTCTILQQKWLLYLYYVIDTLMYVAAVVVILQFLHITLIYVATVVVVL